MLTATASATQCHHDPIVVNAYRALTTFQRRRTAHRRASSQGPRHVVRLQGDLFLLLPSFRLPWPHLHLRQNFCPHRVVVAWCNNSIVRPTRVLHCTDRPWPRLCILVSPPVLRQVVLRASATTSSTTLCRLLQRRWHRRRRRDRPHRRVAPLRQQSRSSFRASAHQRNCSNRHGCPLRTRIQHLSIHSDRRSTHRATSLPGREQLTVAAVAVLLVARRPSWPPCLLRGASAILARWRQ